jgi:protein-disulfide isomerase
MMRRFFAVLGIVGLLAAGESGKAVGQVPSSPAPAPTPPPRVYAIPAGNSPSKGPANAPVVLVVFSDFQCPYCNQVPRVIDHLLQTYPTEVRFIYKEFPMPMHRNALPAARAALAAQRQGKFWEMHDKLFANQGAQMPEHIKQYAQDIGLDMAKFEKDMASPEVQHQIDEEMEQGAQAMVGGTPALFVNGKTVKNRSFTSLKRAIDEELQKKS